MLGNEKLVCSSNDVDTAVIIVTKVVKTAGGYLHKPPMSIEALSIKYVHQHSSLSISSSPAHLYNIW